MKKHTTDLPERLTYTVPEAGKRYGIGRNLAYELARTGRLPGAIRLGRRIVVSRQALEAALNGDASSKDAPDNDSGR